MIIRGIKNITLSCQRGLSYIEVIIATALIAIALVPMLEALQTGIQGANVHQSLTTDHYQLKAKMEEVLAEPFASLLNAAAAAGNKTVVSSYSDSAGVSQRRLVYLSFYDAADSDGDTNPFTLLDPNTDADNNPYTGSDVVIDLLWIRVEIENSVQAFESLTSLL